MHVISRAGGGNFGVTVRSRGMAVVEEFSGRLGSEEMVGEGKM